MKRAEHLGLIMRIYVDGILSYDIVSRLGIVCSAGYIF